MKNNDQDKSYPGYPHYPASEDITRNNNGKQPINADGTKDSNTNGMNELAGTTGKMTGNEADVSAEDLAILDAADQNMNRTDSNNLQQAKLDSVDDDGDMLNEDELDVPGSEDDDENESIGEEDEENNYYSLGGDNHESQEERKGD